MRKYIFKSLIFLVPWITSCQSKQSQLSVSEIQVKAPFDMPAVKMPDFSQCKTYNIIDYGAETGNQESISKALSQAIDKACNTGGGRVIVPRGEWITGPVHLKSGVNLHLMEGAVLLFSDNPSDYLPAVHTSWEGMECYNYSPLIYAYECKNVAITGKGELKAKMDFWKRWFSRPPAHMGSLKRLYHMAAKGVPVEQRQMAVDSANLRPHFIQFNRCENVLLQGVTITNSPFWVIHPYLCSNVVIRDVQVFAHGHNNDGVDPEMSQNVLIENCVFDQGDDAIAIKSGRNQDAWRLNQPSKNMVIRNCFVKNGHQLLAIGSELSGGVENIFMDSCIVAQDAKMFHLLFIKTNERRGGFVNNIIVSNIKAGNLDQGILGIETDVLYQWRHIVPTYERRLTPIQDIHMENVQAGDVKFISRILGQEELPIENVSLVSVDAGLVIEQRCIHENVINFEEQ